jgi:type II secretory pathway component PulF
VSRAEPSFSYVALDGTGRRVKGVTSASDERAAFVRLQAEGLMPIRVEPSRAVGKGGATQGATLSDRELAGFLSNLAALLSAGADIRSALSIIAGKGSTRAVQATTRPTRSAA